MGTGHIDRGDSAFPTLLPLDNGEIVCGFSRGGGAHVSGGTHCARSADGGSTWTYTGVILDRAEDPVKTNHLRLSRCPRRLRSSSSPPDLLRDSLPAPGVRRGVPSTLPQAPN